MNEFHNSIADLSALVRKLRSPDGCPWDREQRLVDLRAYLLEEAHEVAAAIDAGDWTELQAELGDLLFQPVIATARSRTSTSTHPARQTKTSCSRPRPSATTTSRAF